MAGQSKMKGKGSSRGADTRDNSKSVLELQRQALQFHPPPIWFNKKKKNRKDGTSDKEDETSVKTIEIPLNIRDPLQGSIEKSVKILKTKNDPEKWIEWRMAYEETLLELGTPDYESRCTLAL